MIIAVLFSSCSRRTSGAVFEPATGMASVSALCTQVENYSFPDNRTFVSVLDQGDVAITDFKTGNFSVVENGLPTVVTEAKKVNNAADILYTVIVIDQSGSMGSDLNDAKTAAIAYVNAMGANDYAEVILFSDVVLLKQTFTNDKALLIAAINDTVYGPATAFYDAVVTGVHELNARVGRKTVLALTDGYDNASIENFSPLYHTTYPTSGVNIGSWML